MSVLDPSGLRQLSAPELLAPQDLPAKPGSDSSTASTPDSANQYSTAAEEAAAALVDIGGASNITVSEYESSIPPNMAAASALLDELTRTSNNDAGLLSAAYVALSSDDTLSLTAA